jgi:nitric oxide dioxygenase
MTSENERLIRRTWLRIEGRHDALEAAFHGRLAELDPELSALLAGTESESRQNRFAAVLDQMVRALPEKRTLMRLVAASSRRHAEYGVVRRDYDTIGAAVHWALAQQLGDEFGAEERAAWRALYSLLSGALSRAGAVRTGAGAP